MEAGKKFHKINRSMVDFLGYSVMMMNSSPMSRGFGKTFQNFPKFGKILRHETWNVHVLFGMNLLKNLLKVSMNVPGISHDCSTRKKNGRLLLDASVSLENL